MIKRLTLNLCESFLFIPLPQVLISATSEGLKIVKCCTNVRVIKGKITQRIDNQKDIETSRSTTETNVFVLIYLVML